MAKEFHLGQKSRDRALLSTVDTALKRIRDGTFAQLAIAEAKRGRDRGDYAIGAVITQLVGNRAVVIASAGNRVKTSGSSIERGG